MIYLIVALVVLWYLSIALVHVLVDATQAINHRKRLNLPLSIKFALAWPIGTPLIIYFAWDETRFLPRWTDAKDEDDE